MGCCFSPVDHISLCSEIWERNTSNNMKTASNVEGLSVQEAARVSICWLWTRKFYRMGPLPCETPETGCSLPVHRSPLLYNPEEGSCLAKTRWEMSAVWVPLSWGSLNHCHFRWAALDLAAGFAGARWLQTGGADGRLSPSTQTGLEWMSLIKQKGSGWTGRTASFTKWTALDILLQPTWVPLLVLNDKRSWLSVLLIQTV